MNTLIGDIGNTIIKICLVEIRTLKIKKISFLNSNKITSKKYLKKKLSDLLKNSNVNKFALFSSVVPKHLSEIKKILNKIHKIKVKEIKDKNINKIVKINIKNKKQVGSDRIANAVGVYKTFKSNCIRFWNRHYF